MKKLCLLALCGIFALMLSVSGMGLSNVPSTAGQAPAQSVDASGFVDVPSMAGQASVQGAGIVTDPVEPSALTSSNGATESAKAEQLPAQRADEKTAPQRGTSSLPTFVSGKLQWKDDGTDYNGTNEKIFPLQFTKVELLDGSDTSQSATYTDQNGDYGFDDPGTAGPFKIKVSAEGSKVDTADLSVSAMSNSRVTKDSGATYFWISGTVVANSVINNTFEMWDNRALKIPNEHGPAFQVLQATVTAARYAEEMHGTAFNQVQVMYPYGTDGCSYNSAGVIRITGEERRVDLDYWGNPIKYYPQSYASWDVVMHEYGHFLQHQIGGFDNNPAGSHLVWVNMADHYYQHLNGITPLNFNLSGFYSPTSCVGLLIVI